MADKEMNKNKKNMEFEFCKVCKLNHNIGRRHNYIPNHTKALSSFLSRNVEKLSDVHFFLKNPALIRPEHASHARLWCVFCDLDIQELDSSFVCDNAIRHLASGEHLKKLKNFLWKYGGGIDKVDSFRVSDTDLVQIKVWDTERKECLGTLKGHTGSVKSLCSQTCPRPELLNEKIQERRSHGVSCLSQDSNGAFLTASCMDNRIYLYNVLQLDKGPMSTFIGSRFESFYVKSAISPDAISPCKIIWVLWRKITLPYDAQELAKATRTTAAIYLACGVDTSKASVFVQSHVRAHAELMWLLSSATPIGWLNKMIQFKEKSRKAVCIESLLFLITI